MPLRQPWQSTAIASASQIWRMHAKYADGNEAVTECRAVQALQAEQSSLWPGVADPGSEPKAPKRPIRGAAWRRLHPSGWGRLLTAYRNAEAKWRAADAHWQQASGEWTTYQLILGAASAMDASEPPQYHGATC